MNEVESIVLEARKYELLDNLVQQDGWPILLDQLEKVKKVLVDALIMEQDSKKVITLQERYRAFDSVIMTLQKAKDIKEKLYDDIRLIIEDEKQREEFE